MKKILLIVFALLATTTTFGVILDSCEREEIEENDNQEELSIKGDLTGQSVSTFDLNVIGEAMKRMGVAVVNGKIVTNEKKWFIIIIASVCRKSHSFVQDKKCLCRIFLRRHADA